MLDNKINISLDAKEISTIIFSDIEDIENEYKNAIETALLELDLRTFFELLIIVSTEGLKKYFGSNDIVDLTRLSSNDYDKINSYLKKLKVKINIDIVNKLFWVVSPEIRKLSYKEISITKDTKLEELFYIINKDDFIVISFERL